MNTQNKDWKYTKYLSTRTNTTGKQRQINFHGYKRQVCVRDGNGVYSTNVAVYNVRQVPSIFLINRNNELKLRGEDIKDLEAAVKSLL